jgi:hypothetical protein
LFINGQIDPWHALSILPQDDPQNSIMIRDGSHCSNMRSSTPMDSIYLKDARKVISNRVSKWVLDTNQQESLII